jgi:DNA-binding IclR family transcriptional regulator
MSSVRTPAAAYRAPALDKGLDVLECLAAGGVGRTQSQLARDLGRQPSELFRILMTLERRGYVDRDPASGAYSLTLRLFELGHLHSPYDVLLRVADRPMRALTEQLGHGCHLSALAGRWLIVLHGAESAARLRISVAIGSTIAPHAAASGRLLLADLDPEALEELLADAEELDGSLDRTALEERLGRIRARGYEEAHAESMEGISDLSVLVGRPEARTRAALAVTTLTRDHAAFVAATLPPLRECAAAIARAAGLAAIREET